MEKFLVHNHRVNARGAEFDTLRVTNLEDMKNYSYVCRKAEDLDEALELLNEKYEEQYNGSFGMENYFSTVYGMDDLIKNIDIGTSITESNWRGSIQELAEELKRYSEGNY